MLNTEITTLQLWQKLSGKAHCQSGALAQTSKAVIFCSESLLRNHSLRLPVLVAERLFWYLCVRQLLEDLPPINPHWSVHLY